MITIRTYKDYIIYRTENDTRVFRNHGFSRIEVFPTDSGYQEAVKATEQISNDVQK